MKKNSLKSLVILALLSVTTQAETLNESLAKCAKVQDSLARLVCFDDLAEHASMSVSTAPQPSIAVPVTPVETLATPVTKTEVVAAPAANKAAEFGADHLKKSRVVEDEEDQEIVFTIAKLKQDPYGKWRFTFENGQHWKQTDSNRLKVKTGESVVLEKGFMGGIFLKKNDDDANRKIRVKRLK